MAERKTTMSRFIHIESELLNTDHIVSVTNMENGRVEIELVNGRIIDAPEEVWIRVLGINHIVGICACTNLYAVMETRRGHRSCARFSAGPDCERRTSRSERELRVCR